MVFSKEELVLCPCDSQLRSVRSISMQPTSGSLPEFSISTPADFMSTQATDKLYDEAQPIQPNDLPSQGNTVDLTAGATTYKLTAVFPQSVGNDLDLIVKYQVSDISNTAQVFQANTALMKALLAKYPEFREAFAGIVARAVDPSGQDYGSMLPMKEIK